MNQTKMAEFDVKASTYQESQNGIDVDQSAELGEQACVHFGFDVERKGRQTEADICRQGVRIKTHVKF